MPVKVDVGLEVLLKEPPVVVWLSGAMLHAPVPTEGVFPARVIVVRPHVEEPV